MKNTFGSALALTIFGESHGRAIGGVLDGMAAGVPVDEEFIAACMDKRRARGDGLSTPRVEADNVQLLSGVVNGHTTGTAIALMIENQNTRSGDYAKTADLLRPGHADYTAYAKYHGFQDARGGGHFSGRITAALVAGGAIVLGALNRAGIDTGFRLVRLRVMKACFQQKLRQLFGRVDRHAGYFFRPDAFSRARAELVAD